MNDIGIKSFSTHQVLHDLDDGILKRIVSELTFERTFDVASLVGKYFRSDTADLPFLRGPINSTVLIANNGALSRLDNTNILLQNRGGTGVIVNYKGRKFLITATHVIGNIGFGKPANLSVYQKINSDIATLSLDEMKLIYSSQKAPEAGLPVGDIAIFSYDGDIEGVKVRNLAENEKITDTFAIGYPGKYRKVWAEHLDPLISYGSASLKSKQQQNLRTAEYFQKLVSRMTAEQLEMYTKRTQIRNLDKVIFSGVAMPGNSGGGLFDKDGNLLAVCRGAEGTIGKETGMHEFYPVAELLDELDKRGLLS